MRIVSWNTLRSKQRFFVDEAKKGKIFIYPTDTIYGIGAIVTPETIDLINKAKQRLPNKNFSIIAPHFSRIKKHFENTENIENQWQQRQAQFPWRGLTILLEPQKIYHEQAQLLSNNNLVGVRIIQHPFQDFVAQLEKAFITTSANISWQKNITHISDITSEIEKYVDYAIDAWELNNKSSVVIDGVSGEVLRK